MATFTNQSRSTNSFSNQSRNTSTFSNAQKTGIVAGGTPIGLLLSLTYASITNFDPWTNLNRS